ncbi:hypothetical protein EXIGLDRAFT_226361 [Exidia glandulosa HHB12029]|uniref:BTB domain-containing protein n=1 Tax=Exidia glandulosa HHB12029 TaxID=1314781 RepID=A0A165E932_EXIGL|nr:hypothetical protein EXIGLDRAFT_226361 [Exidia glandulosa HHB12029]
MPDKYTVVLRGEAFTLSRDQLQTDSPNYFTELFLGDFEESRTHKVELSRSPQLFRAVVEYMSGYSILPLAPAIIPPAMTAATALENLLRDAEYYGLDGLVHLIRMRPRAVPAPTEAYRALDIAPREALSFQNIITMGKDASDVVFEPDHGIGTLVDGQWKRILICKDVKIM